MASKYEAADWQRLGQAVGRARRGAGYGDTHKWAEAIRRSQRVALGLERGESVGPKTLSAVEDVLGWYPGSTFEILEGIDPEMVVNASPGPRVDMGFASEHSFETIIAWAEEPDTEPPVDILRFFGDAELLGELDRRLESLRRHVAGDHSHGWFDVNSQPPALSSEGGDGDADDTGSSAPTSDREFGLAAHDEEHDIEDEQGHDESP